MEFNQLLQDVHFASMKWMLIIPAALMAIDFLTGFLGAWARHDIQSPKMRSGLAKKCGEIFVILMGWIFTEGMELPEYILTGIVAYIIAMELVSIVENLAIIGVRIPSGVSDKLEQVKKHYESLPEKKKPDKSKYTGWETEHSATEDD